MKSTTKKRKRPIKKRSVKRSLTPEKAFLKSFLALQSEMPELKRTEKVNGGGEGKIYSYTPLPVMRKVLQPLLTKHGFVYAWDFKEANNKIECTCILTHIEGHSKKSTLTAEKDNTVDMNSIQAVGSTMTYLQRYSFKAVLGLTSADDDDDGRSAGKKKAGKEVIPDPKPKSDGEHIKVVQEILSFENQQTEGEKNNDSPKK